MRNFEHVRRCLLGSILFLSLSACSKIVVIWKPSTSLRVWLVVSGSQVDKCGYLAMRCKKPQGEVWNRYWFVLKVSAGATASHSPDSSLSVGLRVTLASA